MKFFHAPKKAFIKITKILICKCVLSPIYYLCSLKPVDRKLVVLADGHQSEMPHSMMMVKKKLETLKGIKIKEYYHDYSFGGTFRNLWTMMRFMPIYARARYVFISDCFVPVSSCKKRKGTTVVQLWHSSGLMKKIGYDSPQEEETLFALQYRNYDVFTVSSPIVGDVLSKAMRLPREVFIDSGVTLLDYNYRKELVDGFREKFYTMYPKYRNKKIVLWAPTFRGTPRDGYLVGQKELLRLKAELSDDYEVIIKTHRYSRMKEHDTDIVYRADMLIHVADMLITDYSSIYYDYLSRKLPIILFCPDLEQYKSERGLYIDYSSLPGKHVMKYDELYEAVVTADSWSDDDYRHKIDEIWKIHMNLCDGKSCEKLFKTLHLTD